MKRGSVKRSGKGWMYVVDLGTDPATGKRRQERKRGFRTQREAADALDARMGEVRTGVVAVDQRLTLSEYLDQWIEAKEYAGVRPTTIRGYRQHIDKYIRPHLGHIRLRDLRGNHIEAMLTEIAKPPRKPGPNEKIPKGARRNPRPMSAASVHRIHATLSSALSSAKKKRLVAFNAAEDVELPRAERPKVRPWEAAELGQFLEHAQSDRLGVVFEVAAMTGLRRGELVGLRWDDIDFDRRRITVRQQLVEVGSVGIECPFCGGEHRQFRFGPPKTSSGEGRIVDLDNGTLGVLTVQRATQELERAKWAEGYRDHGLVFAREDGTPIPPSDLTAKFQELSTSAGLRRIRLHDLRHGQASLMLAAGIPIAVVSKRLGHSSISLTSDTYSHLLDGVGAAAAEAAAALVPRPARDQPASRCDQSVTTGAPRDDEGDPLNERIARSERWGGRGSNPRPTDYESD